MIYKTLDDVPTKKGNKESLTLLVISGVDGSGKSTQAQIITEDLNARNIKSYYFHAITFSLAQKVSQRLRGKSKKTSTIFEAKSESKNQPKAVTEATWFQIQLRKFLLLVDLLRFVRLEKILLKKGYTHIVSDRYFYDTLINILYLSKDKKGAAFGIDFLASLVEPPRYMVYLRVSAKEILSRSRLVEQGEQYLCDKIEIYDTKTKDWKYQLVDGTGTQEEVAIRINERLHKPISVRDAF